VRLCNCKQSKRDHSSCVHLQSGATTKATSARSNKVQPQNACLHVVTHTDTLRNTRAQPLGMHEAVGTCSERPREIPFVVGRLVLEGLPAQAARGAMMCFSTSFVRSSAMQLTTASGLQAYIGVCVCVCLLPV